MCEKTTIVYLTGKPGVGKYTIAKALSQIHDFIICDNQLINNPIFELLQYDGYGAIPDFAWETIARLRDVIFDFLIKSKQANYILTNNLYNDEGDKRLYEQVKQMAYVRGSLFVPIRFTITPQEHLKRITQEERKLRWKSIDPQDIYDSTPLLKISDPHLLVLEVSDLSPKTAAKEILDHIKHLRS